MSNRDRPGPGVPQCNHNRTCRNMRNARALLTLVTARAFWGQLFLAVLALFPSPALGTPALPIIPAYTTNVAQAPYNARADGSTDNSPRLHRSCRGTVRA